MEHDTDRLLRTPMSAPESAAAPRAAGIHQGSDSDRAATLRLLREMLGAAAPRPPLRWVRAAHGRNLRFIKVDDVLYFQSDAKYTRVVTAEFETLIRKPLKELLDELDPDVFWQIHRSTIVNANAIHCVARDSRGLHVRLQKREDRLAVSEGRAHLFRQM